MSRRGVGPPKADFRALLSEQSNMLLEAQELQLDQSFKELEHKQSGRMDDMEEKTGTQTSIVSDLQ